MKRKQIVAGNWKMNTDYEEGRNLTTVIIDQLAPSEILIILCPPFISLKNIGNIVKDISNVRLGAQNCHWEEQGAFTGEISPAMLTSVGVDYVILGHSERREYFHETDELLGRKVKAVLDNNLKPIFCCGEKLDIREKGTHAQLVENQLKTSLFHLEASRFSNVVVAYEPVWAIGTGKTASPEQAQEMHAFIRELIAKKYGKNIADGTSILYGGSCKPENAGLLFSQPDVDGGLIGGASLKTEDFAAIVNSFYVID